MSDIKLEYQGKVTNGVLNVVHRKRMAEDIKQFEGKHVMITIAKKKRKRSNPQNKFYWGVVIPMVKQGLRDAGYPIMGNDKVHDYLKLEFLRDIVASEETGDMITVIKSTTELSTSEFMDFIAQLQQWASEFLNIYIPDPNEN